MGGGDIRHYASAINESALRASGRVIASRRRADDGTNHHWIISHPYFLFGLTSHPGRCFDKQIERPVRAPKWPLSAPLRSAEPKAFASADRDRWFIHRAGETHYQGSYRYL